MNLKNFSIWKIWKDSKGILLSTDLLLSMVVITVTLGITANALDMVSNPMVDYSMRSDMERAAIEATDILINTPGSPANWETFNRTYLDSPGLAEISTATGKAQPLLLSYNKICLLKNNYNEVMEGKVFPKYMGSSITIYPLNRTLEPICLNGDPPTNSSEIVVVNRTVMCDYQYINCTLHINTSNENYSSFIAQPEICPHESHGNSVSFNNSSEKSSPYKWNCKHFIFNTSTLNTTDYYLISEGSANNARWIFDRSEIASEEELSFSSVPLKLNNKISQLIGNEKQCVLWLHVKMVQGSTKQFNVYIVAVPKDTDINDVKTVYINPQPCYFILKVWLI